ncbi:MAG: hypothetical protein RL417_2301, partial [Pseudomonadota bacterium]
GLPTLKRCQPAKIEQIKLHNLLKITVWHSEQIYLDPIT